MQTPTSEPMFSLHRYFLQADQMQMRFDRLLHDTSRDSQGDDQTRQVVYMSLWYGCLFVVVEGYEEIAYPDERVDAFLAQKSMVDLLRRFRNGAFHYQRTYWDDRFVAFVSEGAQSAEWVRGLHSALSDMFLRWFAEQRA